MCIVESEAVDFSLNHYSGIRHGILFSKKQYRIGRLYLHHFILLFVLVERFMKDSHATELYGQLFWYSSGWKKCRLEQKNHLKFLFLEQHLAEEIVQGKIIGVPLYDLLKRKRDIRKNTKIGYVEILTWYILWYIFLYILQEKGRWSIWWLQRFLKMEEVRQSDFLRSVDFHQMR